LSITLWDESPGEIVPHQGKQSHALFDHTREKIGVSLMWVWLEKFGVALHGGF